MDIESVVEKQENPNIVDFKPGDTVRVYFKIVESGRERTQPFTGIVIRKRRAGIASNFTVRQIAHSIGVERTFPFYSPLVSKVEMVEPGNVRKAKLYYIRGLSRKKTRTKIKG
ncbi:MAG: 50S ribosomal protein L19 [Chloroflexota bacterium]